MFVEFAVVHMSARGTKLLNARALVCPEELAKADMRPFRGGDSAFDPKRSSQSQSIRAATTAWTITRSPRRRGRAAWAAPQCQANWLSCG